MKVSQMRKAEVFVHGKKAALLYEKENPIRYLLEYRDGYEGEPVSLTLPTSQRAFEFDGFPAFFEGLLPEGGQLEGLLRREKLDRSDYFGQLVFLGNDLVGAVTVREIF